ncbi:hypothetical protein JOC78_001349 [Bacillus ectoiniformans]|uniref:S-layer homology domain-containing protein n=1 Tax=Bacillus ectoiniformans TaxID=1494429 RepID=UPI00195B03A3|nr:S-layer homology domain-containing protein [Bacillus ectoiniformans]MBM7648407.1 hypothetical protein [Bacillus ectoiniformans]
MNNWRALMFLVLLLLSWGVTEQAHAHVTDETKSFKAQSEFESRYTLVASYKGASGVTFKSYSTKWGTDKLKLLEQELLKNKHGSELSYLQDIMIFPDYPSGEGVMGMYYAEYEYNQGKYTYNKGRKIHLYGGNQYTTVPSLAYTMSHEYGHHLTYYQLVQKEQLDVDSWKQSNYYKSRSFSRYPKIHTNPTGDYIWNMAEQMAEDYVQLFGSELAISKYLQMNTDVAPPFETPSIYSYWATHFGSQFKQPAPLSLYLTGYKKYTNSTYDLDLSMKYPASSKLFLKGESSSSKQVSALMGEWPTGQGDFKISFGNRPFEVSGYMLDAKFSPAIKLQAIQHNGTGYNRGSGFLNIPYAAIDSVVTDKSKLMPQTAAEIKGAITKAANDRGIPAEILKAIAYQKSGLKHWDTTGKAVLSAEGGIGVMGINPEAPGWKEQNLDVNRLKTDVHYNIQSAANYLVKQWNNTNLPKVNKHEMNKIEDWYFAILAYDGVKGANLPGEGHTPFQEAVFTTIRNHSQLPIGKTPVIEAAIDEGSGQVTFNQMQYQWPTATPTKQSFEKNQTVYTSKETVLETAIGKGGEKVLSFTPYQITDIQETNDPKVHTVYYGVSGHTGKGYVSCNGLAANSKVTWLKDLDRPEVQRAVTYLQIKNIINGYGDSTYRPNQQLYRRHAAKLLVDALDLKLPAGYQMQAKDMKPGDLNYEEMKIAEAHGLIGQGSDLRPNEFLSRNQMAAILIRAYGKELAQPSTQTNIQDVPKGFWNYPAINQLSFNQITIANPYRLNDMVTRSQFALFLERTIKKVN